MTNTKFIFVELEGVLATPKNGEVGTHEAIKKYFAREEVIEIINLLSNHFEIVVFSATEEEERTAIEDFLVENNVQTDNVLLRDEYNRGTAANVRNKILSDFFDGNENKRFVETHSIYTNHEKFTELLLDEEYTVFQVG